MAAIAFDTLAYVRRVVAAGTPREQAEAQAEAMKEAFVHNVDALVTRDYLDARFTEFETRLEVRTDRRFAEFDLRLERMEGKFNLVYWMQGLTIVCVVIPVIRGYLG